MPGKEREDDEKVQNLKLTRLSIEFYKTWIHRSRWCWIL